MGFFDKLDQEAGINFDDLDKEAGIAPVPTASRMLKRETVRTQEQVARVKTEDPVAAREQERTMRQRAMPRSLLRLPGRRARYAKVGMNENEKFREELRTIRDSAEIAPEFKDQAMRESSKARLAKKMDTFQQIIQSPYDMKVMIEDAKALRKAGTGAKMTRRVERGMAMLAGGGAHMIDEILAIGGHQFSATGDEITSPGEAARMYHQVLQSPELQPVIDGWVDKYVGGAVESGPFMMAAMAPAVLTGGATVPSLLGGFAVAYGVEGNSIYQANLDAGRSEQEARLRGIVGGLMSAGVEVVGGSGAKYYSGKVANKVVGKLARAKQLTHRTVTNALKEGFIEELPQEVIGMVMGGDAPRDADGNLDYNAIAQQLADVAAIATFTGGFVDLSVNAATSANVSMKNRAMQAEMKDMEAAQQEYEQAESVAKEQRVTEQEQQQTDYRHQVVDRKVQEQLEAKAAESMGRSVEEFRQLGPDAQREAVQSVQTVETEQVEEGVIETPESIEHDTKAAEATGMSLEEAQDMLTYVDKAGTTQTPKPGSISVARLLEQPMREAATDPLVTPTERLNKKGMLGLGAKIKSGVAQINDTFTTLERMMERLDKREGGPLHTYFMQLRDKAYERKENTQVAVMNAETALKDLGFQPEWMSDIQTLRKGLDLTTAHRMGVAMLAKNEKGRRQVIEGMKLTAEEVDGMYDSLSPEQQQIMGFMEEVYEKQWEEVTEAALAAGMNPKDLLKEAWYSPIHRTDVDSSEQHDLVTMLTNQFTQESKMPDRKMLEKRKHGAGEIELDAVSMFMQNLAKVEAFKSMAPLVANLNKVTSNQRFMKHLNRATHGQGGRILNKWIADTVRGQSVDSAQVAAKISKHLRHKSMVYLLNHNILISSKQWISIFQAMAADKGVGSAMLHNMTLNPKAFKAMEELVRSKSTMVRTRDFDREFQRKVDAESVKRTMEGKKRADENAVKWIKTIDNITVITTWKALYDVAQAKGMDEAASVKYADKWVARTQPMGDAVDLPDFFRGGELAKVLTSFQRMPNQVWNLVAHDIVGAKMRGDITTTEAGRRALVSLVLPALVFGLMRRGRPQKDWEELVEDMLLYPLGVIPLAGSWATSAIKGFKGQSFVGMLGPEELTKAATAAVKGKWDKTLLHGAKSLGAFTGRGGAQAARTAEGIYDILRDETDDPRRLLYSEYALNGKDRKGSSSSRRPRRRARPPRNQR